MKVKVKLKPGHFPNAIRALAKASGKPIEEIVRAETAVVLEKAMSFTPAADSASLKDRAANPPWIRIDGTWHKLPHKNHPDWKEWRVSDSKWSKIGAKIKRGVALAAASRGLMKASWLRLAEFLGLDIKAPAYVQNAVARSSKGQAANPGNFEVTTSGRDGSFTITFTNAQVWRKGSIMGLLKLSLGKALKGRYGYFKKNLEKGVFKSIREVKARYPRVFK